MSPARALLHPAFVVAVVVLALNDHVLKGSHLVPAWATGKLSDFAGLFAAPVVLAALVRARRRALLLACYGATGLVFAAIKLSPAVSTAFVGVLAHLGLRWRNWCDPSDLVALPMLGASFALLAPVMERRAARLRARAELAAVIAALPVMAASGDNLGGANSGGHSAGDEQGGVNVAVGDIAIDPTGHYFVSRSGGELLLGDLPTRALRTIRLGISPDRIAFFASAQGEGFYAIGPSGGGERLIAWDVSGSREAWHADFSRTSDRIVVDPGGSRVALFSETDAVMVDAATGLVAGAFAPADGITDLRLAKDGGRILVTARTRFDAKHSPVGTNVYVRAVGDASAICTIDVPNCADELVLAPDGHRAFLAPTFCQKDPVTVIDVVACTVDKQLPGFGPVALSQNGRTAVAFLDRDSVDPLAPPMPAEVLSSDARFHLMFIDVTTLAYGTLAIGDALPRYAVTPDGKLLLVDSSYATDNVRILDVDTRTLRTVSGPKLLLEDYVLTPDSAAAYAIWSGLFRIDTQAATATEVPLSFTATAINIVPSGSMLLLKDDVGTVHLYDLTQKQAVGVIR